LQLHHVVSDIAGETGPKIIRAIVNGQRNRRCWQPCAMYAARQAPRRSAPHWSGITSREPLLKAADPVRYGAEWRRRCSMLVIYTRLYLVAIHFDGHRHGAVEQNQTRMKRLCELDRYGSFFRALNCRATLHA
jgi:hypothetical protein